MFAKLKATIPAFCASLLVAIATVGATNANADNKKPITAVVVSAPDVGDYAPHRSGYKVHRISRYGAYYPPRFIVVTPGADESEESYDESDEDEFDATDRDNDGFISFREARRMNAQWVRDFRRIDTSGDGFLTREEVDAFYRR
ncbi:MAG: hypothetical protein ACRDAM_11550 [Casimicrobium sp.]